AGTCVLYRVASTEYVPYRPTPWGWSPYPRLNGPVPARLCPLPDMLFEPVDVDPALKRKGSARERRGKLRACDSVLPPRAAGRRTQLRRREPWPHIERKFFSMCELLHTFQSIRKAYSGNVAARPWELHT